MVDKQLRVLKVNQFVFTVQMQGQDSEETVIIVV